MVAKVLNVDDFIFRQYQNIKTGRKYYVTKYCINTTNGQDGKIMLLYYPVIDKNEIENARFYCRELHEFNQKFEEVNN